jgi:hypothetical protein
MSDGELTPIEWTPLRRVLARMMSDLSEDCYCAGWLTDTEFSLWALVVGDPNRGAWSVQPMEIEALRELAELSGAWIVWPRGWNREAPVALGDWVEVYAARRAREAETAP